ncbi:MAG: hypothetical protein U0235_28525 [Polyangiaceae bacterium]
MRGVWWAFLAVVTVVLSLGGCSDDKASGGAGDGNVGPEGGTITSADGKAKLVIPAGALSSRIAVSLSAVADGFTPDPTIIPGTTYALDAPEVTLAAPAELTVDLPASATPDAPQAADVPDDPKATPPIGFQPMRLDRSTRTPAHAGHLGETPTGPRLGEAVAVGSPVRWQVGCEADQSACWWTDYYGVGCNSSLVRYINKQKLTYPVLLAFDSDYHQYDSSGNVIFRGRASYCAQVPPPQPKLGVIHGSLGGFAAKLSPGAQAKATINAVAKGMVGILMDITPPKVTVTKTIAPAGNNQSTIKLTATATDNVGVTKVRFSTLDGQVLNQAPWYKLVPTFLADVSAPPYEWTSGPLDATNLYGRSYLACAFDAANNQSCDWVVPQQGPPTIQTFTATPTALPAGGGDVTLAWSVDDYNLVTLDGLDVSPYLSKVMHVTQTTTFTLKATNVLGESTATALVTVGAPPLPTINSFTATPNALSGAGNVTLAWDTSDATSVSIDQGVPAINGATGQISVAVSATKTFTLTATNVTGNTTKSVNVVVSSPGDRFVDATNGNDATGDGTLAKPYKTINKALTTGTPTNVYLANGTYDGTNQTPSTFNVPDGVAFHAVNAGQATIKDLQITMLGSGSFTDVGFDGNAAVFAQSATGSPTLTVTGCKLHSTASELGGGHLFHVGGKVVATVTPGALAGGIYTLSAVKIGPIFEVTGSGALHVNGGIFDGNNVNDLGSLVNASGTSSVVFDAVTVRNIPGINASSFGVFTITGSSAVTPTVLTLQNGTTLDNFDPSNTYATAGIRLGGSVNVTLDNATISKGPQPIVGTISDSTITLKGGTKITNNLYGMTLTFSGGTNAVNMNGATFSNNVNGGNIPSLYITGTSSGTVAATLTNATFTANTRAIGVNVTSLKMRSCSVTGNGSYGVEVINIGATAAVVDLGKVGDLGGNTLSGNTTGNLHTLTGGVIDAVGNTWDVSTQGSDAAGHYATPTQKTGVQSGQNYTTNAGSTINF